MKNRNAEYWEERFTLIEENRYNDCMALYDEISKLMDENMKNLSDDIELFIYKFAKDNRISFFEARKLMNSKELEEFRWNVNRYIEYGEKNALTSEFTAKLKNASNRVHMNRLEAIKIQCQYIIESTFGQTIEKVDSFIKSTYENELYHAAFEIEKGTGVGCSFAKVNKKKLDLVVNKAWTDDGINFSGRLWNRSKAMNKSVERELTRIATTGENANKCASRIVMFAKEQGQAAKQNAKTLILTENSYFASQARQESFKKLGVEEFQCCATLDTRTSKVCRGMDLEHFPMSEYKVGVTAPPFHPRCRTVTIPYFEDLGGTRSARDENGNSVTVSGDIQYQEWYEQYVKE